MTNEEALIRAFVDPSRRSRLVGFLSTPDGRAKLRQELTHFRWLDKRFCQQIPPGSRTPEGIEQMLRAMGASDDCLLLSEDEDLDGLEIALADGLEWVVGSGMATFVSCIPGRLAYFEGEDPGDCCVLERAPKGADG